MLIYPLFAPIVSAEINSIRNHQNPPFFLYSLYVSIYIIFRFFISKHKKWIILYRESKSRTFPHIRSQVRPRTHCIYAKKRPARYVGTILPDILHFSYATNSSLTWSVCERFAENITAFKQLRPCRKRLCFKTACNNILQQCEITSPQVSAKIFFVKNSRHNPVGQRVDGHCEQWLLNFLSSFFFHIFP